MSIEEILKLPFVRLFTYLFCAFTSICPGILLLYMHKPELFSILSVMILIMLAVAITNPIFLLNILLAAQFIPFNAPNRSEAILFTGSLFSYTFFGTVLLLDYFFIFHLKFVVFLIVLIQAFWSICVILFNKPMRKGFAKSTYQNHAEKNENNND